MLARVRKIDVHGQAGKGVNCMAKIPSQFRKEYPDAAKLVDELGLIDVKADGRWWAIADKLVRLAPVLPRVNSAEKFEGMTRQEWADEARSRLQAALDDRVTRGSPRQRLEKLVDLAKAEPGVCVITAGFDSVEWQHLKRSVRLVLTFRDSDWTIRHEWCGTDEAKLLAQAEQWGERVNDEVGE